jgi:hypothetical protein
MKPLVRQQRIALVAWTVLAVALWNGIFEMMVVRGVKEYLFRAAQYEAARRPFTPVTDVMDPAIFQATWVATLWTSVVLLMALLTIRSQGRGLEAQGAQRRPESRREP